MTNRCTLAKGCGFSFRMQRRTSLRAKAPGLVGLHSDTCSHFVIICGAQRDLAALLLLLLPPHPTYHDYHLLARVCLLAEASIWLRDDYV